MVYLAGDNNLESFGYKDLREMKRAGSNENVNIIAQFDTMHDQVARRYCLTAGSNLEDDVVEVLPETNTGDPDQLQEFIEWSAANYPAHHYGLILWNHGSGWKDDDIYRAAARNNLTGTLTRGNIVSLRSGKPGRTLFSTSLEELVKEATLRAILFDDSAADFLDSQEMRKVLEKVQPLLNGGLDLLGFDACLMNMVEVVYQVHDLCQVVVGSQEVEPGDGWPYDTILSELVQQPQLTAPELGSLIVDKYVDFYVAHHPNLAVTQSAVSTSSTAALTAALDELAQDLHLGMQNHAVLGAVVAALRESQTFTDRDYVDLGDFCAELALLTAGTSLGDKAAAVAAVVKGPNSPVIAQKSHGDAVSKTTGLSIYIPARVLSPLYEKLKFSIDYKWDDFLQELVG